LDDFCSNRFKGISEDQGEVEKKNGLMIGFRAFATVNRHFYRIFPVRKEKQTLRSSIHLGTEERVFV